MIQFLTSIFILLNPAVGFLTHGPTPVQSPPAQEAAFLDFENYKLPLSDGIFMAAQLIPASLMRDWNVPNPQITAKTAFIFEATHQRILWQKNDLHESRSVASLTKLMTALVIMENAKMDEVFKVSKQAVETPGEMGGLFVDEEITVENLLYALLIESSNDAAIALAEGIEKKTINSTPATPFTDNKDYPDFIDLMNKKARSLNLKNTSFTDPSGLDPGNRSSAWDLNIIMQTFLKYSALQKITQTAAADIKSYNGEFNHHLVSTNKLLNQHPEIIAGKTGYTEEAGNCMILAWNAPDNQGKIISIIMDSQDRTKESELILEWTNDAYLW